MQGYIFLNNIVLLNQGNRNCSCLVLSARPALEMLKAYLSLSPLVNFGKWIVADVRFQFQMKA